MPPDTTQLFERIVQEELRITSLQFSDNAEDNIHTLSVWEIETVMERAYQAGFAAASKPRQPEGD